MSQNDRVQELEEKVEELTEELERVKNRKTGDEEEEEVGEIQDQVQDAAEDSRVSRRKFMKMIGGGAAGLSAAAVLPSVSGFTFKDDKSFKFGNLSSSQTNVEIGTGGNLNLRGNDITGLGQIGKSTNPASTVYAQNFGFDKPIAGWDTSGNVTGYDTIQAALDDGNPEVWVLTDFHEEAGISWDDEFTLTDTVKIKGVGKRPVIENPNADDTPILDPVSSNASSYVTIENLQLGDNDSRGTGPAIDGNFHEPNGQKVHRWTLRNVRTRHPIVILGADELRMVDTAGLGQNAVDVSYEGNNYTVGCGAFIKAQNSMLERCDFGNNAPKGEYGVRFIDCVNLTVIDGQFKHNDTNNSDTTAMCEVAGCERTTFIGSTCTGAATDAQIDFDIKSGPIRGSSSSLRMLNIGIGGEIRVDDGSNNIVIDGLEGSGPWTLTAAGCQNVEVRNAIPPVTVEGFASDNVRVMPSFGDYLGNHAGGSYEFNAGFITTDGSNMTFEVTDNEVSTKSNAPLTLPTRSSDPGTGELDDGKTTIYVSDGSSGVTGDDGDVVAAVNNGGTVKTKTLLDFSAT